MKRLVVFTLASAVIMCSVAADQLTGREILDKAMKRYRGDNSVLTVLLSKAKIDNPDDKKEFEITTYRQVRPEVLKALIAVRRAEKRDKKPILFLVWDWKSSEKKDRLWYCLPSLGNYHKVSIEKGEKMTARYGFSIEDMKVRDLDRADHELKGLVEYEGEKVYKVVSVPHHPKEEGFKKVVSMIRPGNWTAALVKYIDPAGDPWKILRVHEVKKVDGIWTEMRGRHEDYEHNYMVDFEVQKVRYNLTLSPKLFVFTEPPYGIIEGS